MNKYLQIEHKINYLLSYNYYKNVRKTLIRTIIGCFLFLFIVFYIFSKSGHTMTEVFVAILFSTPPILFIMLLIVSLINVITVYKKIVKNHLNRVIVDKKEFDKLYMKSEVEKEIKNYIDNFNGSKTILTIKNIQINRDNITMQYIFDNRPYTITTTDYVKSYDNGDRRVEAIVIEQDIIYGLLKGDLFKIVLYNY